ncbi:beta strand repeat-containing protein, partial [Spirosoma daeguense]
MKHLFFSLILRSFLVCCNLLLIIHSPLLAQSFQPAINYNADTTPSSVAVGDFNGDGKLDLVSANRGSNNVSVLLNNGAGGFGAAINFPVGSAPSSVAVGDFNGDGRLDLAISNGGSGNVSVLLGNGAGSFGAAINFPVGSYPVSVVVGDINNDGKLDLVTANFTSSTVSVLLGDGLGAFGAAINFPAGDSPAYAAMGDLNGDGNQDLAIAHYNGITAVSILLSDGSGGFTPSTVVNGLGGQPFMIVVRDLNSDGKLDVALAHRSNNVVVLLGDGTGGFAAPSLFGVGTAASSVAVGDFNGDGNLDLTIANLLSNTVSVLLGDGAGAFGAATHLSVGVRPQSVVVGDFNGDGRPDLATANLNTNNISVLLNEIVTPPVAQDDMATTTSGTPVAITVTANDTALYGNTLNVGTVTIINPASNGSLSVNTTTGEVTYSPSPACFVGQDSFTYTINDNTGLTSNTATVTIDVQALPLTLTNFASSPAVVCTGSPITFTATVGNASCGYSYTLTDGSSTTTGSSSSTDFSQSLTPTGSGLQSFTLTLVNNALSASATTDVTLSTPASATIAYAGSPFSTTSAAVNVTRTGTANGTYTASPSGLSLNASTGQITPASSTPGNYTVTYSVASSGGCPVFSTTAALTIQAAPSIDLRINLVSAGPTAVPGDQILYVTGINGTDVENVVLTNVLPASVTLISATFSRAIGPPIEHSITVNGNIVQVTIPNLPSGRYAFGAQVRIDPASTGTLTTTASITATTADLNPSDNTAELSLTLTPQADLSVTLTDAQTAVQAGSPVTYTLVVANSGLSNAPNVIVTDIFPPSLTGVSWTASGAGGGTTAQASGYGNLNQTVNLPVGGSVRFVITGTLSASAIGSLTNTASVTSAAGVSDPDETNNSVTNTVTVIPLMLPSISGFSALSNNVCVGSPVSFTASVGNVTGNYAYTLSNGTSTTTGSLSSTSFSQSLTPTGSGLQSFTLTLVNNALSASATTDVTLSTPASATIAYAGSPFSTTSAAVNVTRTGTANGTYTASPSGLSLNASTGQITPASSTPGNYTVTYSVASSGGCPIFSTIATLTIQPPTNQKPVAVDDNVDVLSNTTTPGNVLTNDTDPDGHPLAASLVVAPINGMIILNADGSFSYSPNLGFIGRDSLTYQICDSPASPMPSLCDSAKVYFNVQSNAPTLTGLMATVSAVCAGSPVTFTATIGNLTGAYNFTMTNGTSTTNGNSSSTVFNQRVLAAGSGPQSFTLTVEAGGQQTTATTVVTVNALPVATLLANLGGILTCTQTSLTLTAGGGDTYSFAGPSIVSQDATLGRATVNASGFYSVTVSASGCTSTTSITIGQDNNVPLVSISANPSLTITSGQSTTLTASGATSYIWSTGEIANFIVVNAAGPYSLTGTTGNGCSATTSVVVSLTTAPAGPFSITGVTANTCQQIASNRYVVSFTPQYTGTNGQPISLSVVNELFPTTAPGPYTLQLYTDNPTITLKAQQGGTSGEASFVYNWLAACSNPQPNTPPRVNQHLTDQIARVGEGFGYTIPQNTFTDNESPQSLVLTVSGLPAGLSFSAPTQIGGVPTLAGVRSVTVTATDPQGLSVSTSFILTVVETTATNTPPTVANPIVNQVGVQGQPFG